MAPVSSVAALAFMGLFFATVSGDAGQTALSSTLRLPVPHGKFDDETIGVLERAVVAAIQESAGPHPVRVGRASFNTPQSRRQLQSHDVTINYVIQVRTALLWAGWLLQSL
jgi:hypothetical protein